MTDDWEDGFDTWTPPRQGDAPDDTGVDLDREALLRLARELAAKRQAEQGHGSDELEQLKQVLRERAEAIAHRERELAELQRRLESGKQGKRDPGTGGEALVARERAALERAQAVEKRERDLQRRAADLDAETARVQKRVEELAARLAEAEARAVEASAERELATAERDHLEERERAARAVEKELAALRVDLERQREREPAALESASPSGEGGRERELRRLEARLDERERELALVRQGLDAERNALRERERTLRRREVAEARQTFEAPLAPPSFSEGLAAFARRRSR